MRFITLNLDVSLAAIIASGVSTHREALVPPPVQYPESRSWAATGEIPHELVNFLMQTAKANNSTAIRLSLALFAARVAGGSNCEVARIFS